MTRTLLTLWCLAAFATQSLSPPAAEAQSMSKAVPPASPDHPFAPDRHDPPRAQDGARAIQSEYDAAVRIGTAEALDLFIARHPGHALVAEAERRRASLRRR